MIKIRQALSSDTPGICNIHQQSFGTSQGKEIADLVTQLLADQTAYPLKSLVAEVTETKQQVLGHILFTNVRITGSNHSTPNINAQILAPLAVLPTHQRLGIGSCLVLEGLKQLTANGVDLIFVLGNPDYYSKFGFKPARGFGLLAPQPIPSEYDDAWMVLALTSGILGNIRGQVICSNTLNQPQHWQ